jgi:hypothetical protein
MAPILFSRDAKVVDIELKVRAKELLDYTQLRKTG